LTTADSSSAEDPLAEQSTCRQPPGFRPEV